MTTIDMKRFIITFLLLLLFCTGISQDKTIIISPAMEISHTIALGKMDGWVFRKGNDKAWAKRDIPASDWEKLKPSGLSENQADENGRLEGWLRIKIILDTAFRDTTLELRMNSWSAVDVYVDGNLLTSFGNTGTDGKSFKEYSIPYKLPVPFNIEKGTEHLLAVHFVDFLSPLPPFHLKSEQRNEYFLTLITPQYKTTLYGIFLKTLSARTLWLTVNITLCLLFWLLAFQNRAEKNLQLIALTTTGLTLLVYLETNASPGISYFAYRLSEFLLPMARVISMLLALLLMLRIFKRRITRFFKISAFVLIVAGIIQTFWSGSDIIILQATLILFFNAYYIITSWKTLNGAQWALLAGVILAVSSGLLLATSELLNPGLNYDLELFYTSGLYLFLPLSLLVYVAMRFREIIKDVRQNAQKVVQLSEEKKEQAINQQKILAEEVKRQTAEIRNTLENLKATQSQLIQSEKMASLGELTAGIAHEIQNPLNFVNNFSEVNAELIEELKILKSNSDSDLDKNERDEKLESELLNDIAENEKKINYHGKRADAIVKGMLQHSRSSTGQKEPTDINMLADEYLRLAYHGLRAKDKNFNATIKTDFDESIGSINIIPQDMGRVLLNLYNNAFYAVSEKKKLAEAGYEPTVSIITRKTESQICITVKDNGIGISQKIVDKIFQPFFTTKPTGQGTGLGLSLSYDIVKAHGGELRVETREGEGSEFEVILFL
jgi:two-component system NtrC family sensor kinase